MNFDDACRRLSLTIADVVMLRNMDQLYHNVVIGRYFEVITTAQQALDFDMYDQEIAAMREVRDAFELMAYELFPSVFSMESIESLRMEYKNMMKYSKDEYWNELYRT